MEYLVEYQRSQKYTITVVGTSDGPTVVNRKEDF